MSDIDIAIGDTFLFGATVVEVVEVEADGTSLYVVADGHGGRSCLTRTELLRCKRVEATVGKDGELK